MTTTAQRSEPIDHALAARRAITTAIRDNKNDSDPTVTALVAVANAILAGTDALHELTAAYTGPDGVCDLLSAVAGHGDRIQSDIAEIARLANRR